jgi:chemotaxis protein methyltransferase CheR
VRQGVFDLILCRNVLMYFTPAQASKVVGALHGALHESGWLAVAPCEASQTLFARFRSAHCDGAIFYRKGRPRNWGVATTIATRPLTPATQVRAQGAQTRHSADGTSPVVQKPVTRHPAPKPAGPLFIKAREAARPAEALGARALALADQRRMDEALACCDRWIAAEKLDPAAHYLRGMILTETGEVIEACAALERSLYLAPGGVMASLALANLERVRGRDSHAVRHYRNVLM